jgi:hypothetical protein
MVAQVRSEVHAAVFGDPLVAVDVHAESSQQPWFVGAIVLGIDRHGRLPAVDPSGFDLLLTTASSPSRPWVGLRADEFDTELAALARNARAHPLAATTLAQVLRVGERLPIQDALLIESLAYSTLLGGTEFHTWRASHPPRQRASDGDSPRVRFARDDDAVRIELARPLRRNAFDARMRDQLVDALQAIEDDPTVRSVTLEAEGKDFSAGGDLDEFGTSPDPAMAHAIRTLRSPAELVARLRERVTACVHGACVGAGIEIPAAAGRLVAAANSWFRLPELAMGLIPGAGGTATIPRRIGRHRTLYWTLSSRTLAADDALEWGLVDELRGAD